MKLLNYFKSDQRLIDEIHSDFDSAQDRLYQFAMKTIEQSKVENPDKANLLQKHGFTSNKIVVEAIKAGQEKEAALEQANLINYYKKAYPFLKYITESELERICEKYSLIFAPVKNYKNAVPEKNLMDIENAQPLKMEDSYYESDRGTSDFYVSGFESGLRLRNSFSWAERMWMGEPSTQKKGLFIAAPKAHFDLTGLEKGKQSKFGFFTPEPKDPIVFRYVRGGIQILTMWGLEANDPSLQNEIYN